MRRYAFIPDDFKQPIVLGWGSRSAAIEDFVPDEPLTSKEGLLIRVKISEDTPTEPPPPDAG